MVGGNTHITLMSTPTKNIGRGRTPEKNPKNLAESPVRALKITTNGQIRPLTYYNGNKVGDVRWLSGTFLLSLQTLWDEMGDDILRRVAASHPELLLMAMCKIAAVQRVEVASLETSPASRPRRRLSSGWRSAPVQRRESCLSASSRRWRSCKQTKRRSANLR